MGELFNSGDIITGVVEPADILGHSKRTFLYMTTGCSFVQFYMESKGY